jgi:eukaryotic-like serine/threonine-protein kinase
LNIVEAPRGLVVEQLVSVRHRSRYEELAGVTSGTPVSVAVTNPSLFTEPTPSSGSRSAEDVFVAAVRRSTAIDHPCVARTLALEAAGAGRWAVAWERFSGPSLEQVLAQKGHLNPDEAVTVTHLVAQAVASAHEREVVHGDLRASWVTMLTNPTELELKVGGFGVAQLDAIIERKALSEVDDVVALGALLHELLTGKRPQHKVGHLPANAMHLASVLGKSLGFEPSQRIETVEEFLQALGEANRTRVSGGSVVLPKSRKSGFGLRKVGAWELVSLLGEGAMGQVFLARHTLLGRQAAIKVLRPEQYQREDLIQRFFQEARSVNQINHEHIVEISDFGQELGADGKPVAVYFVMELLQGETLTSRMANGAMSVSQVVHIIGQLASALGAAHRLGVVHRDVKTDNVFLISRNGDPSYVKVLDFGVAKLTQHPPDAPMVSTMDGAIIGTPTSMSPEQASGAAVDQRADVYAVGVLLYQLLSGKLPIDADNFGKLIALLLTKVPEPLPPATPKGEVIPQGLAGLVMRCLEKDPAARPASMDAVLAGLAAFDHAAPPAALETRGAKPSKVKTTWLGAAGVALVLGVASAVWLRPRGGDVKPQPIALPAVVLDAGVSLEPLVEAEPLDAGEAPMGEVPDAGAVDAIVRKKVKPIAITGAVLDRSLQPVVRACLDAQTQAPSQLVIHVVVELSGAVKEAKVLTEGLTPALVHCLERRVAGARLPPNTNAPSGNYIFKRP